MGVATLGDSRRYDCRIDNRKSAIAFKANAAQERALAPAYKTAPAVDAFQVAFRQGAPLLAWFARGRPFSVSLSLKPKEAGVRAYEEQTRPLLSMTYNRLIPLLPAKPQFCTIRWVLHWEFSALQYDRVR
jgi:hypothetical protein